MNINELREQKHRVERSLYEFISRETASFQKNTKICISSIHVDLAEANIIGENTRVSMVMKVRINLDI